MIKITAFAGDDTPETFKVMQGNESFDPVVFGVTRTDVSAGGVTISSIDGSVSWEGDVITVMFGRLNLPPRFYDAKIMVYSDLYPNGVTIAGPGKVASIGLNFQA